MRKPSPIVTSMFALFSLLVVEGVASAQTNKAKPYDDSKVDVMVFPDDKLLTVGSTPTGGIIGAGHIPVRTLLVRPRLHFVPELYKSIENL